MSLSVDGVWKAGVWAQTVWADGVWREGAAPEPEPEQEALSGGKKKRRYPRKFLLDGRVYNIQSPQQERQLLQAVLDRANEQKAAEPEAKEPAKRVLRITRRLQDVDSRESEWLDHLKRIDEELLLLM